MGTTKGETGSVIEVQEIDNALYSDIMGIHFQVVVTNKEYSTFLKDK